MQGLQSDAGDVTAPSDSGWHADPLAAEAGVIARMTGSGPDLVLVHGSVGDYRQWVPIAHQLRGQYRIASVSRRFHWPRTSAPAGAAYTYEIHRDDLLRYLRTRERPVHLIGHSYGAGVVLLAALAEPALLQ